MEQGPGRPRPQTGSKPLADAEPLGLAVPGGEQLPVGVPATAHVPRWPRLPRSCSGFGSEHRSLGVAIPRRSLPAAQQQPSLVPVLAAGRGGWLLGPCLAVSVYRGLWVSVCVCDQPTAAAWPGRSWGSTPPGAFGPAGPRRCWGPRRYRAGKGQSPVSFGALKEGQPGRH